MGDLMGTFSRRTGIGSGLDFGFQFSFRMTQSLKSRSIVNLNSTLEREKIWQPIRIMTTTAAELRRAALR